MTCSETLSRRPLERAHGDPENGFRRQIAHAAMMAFRADRSLARSARYPMKYMPRLRMIGAGPGDVRRPEQRDDRRLKGRREVPRAGVGRDQERRPADASLGESDTKRLIGQADNVAWPAAATISRRRFALVRSAKYQDRHTGRVGQSPRQFGEMGHGPVLGGTECPAGVQANDPPLASQPQGRKGPVGRGFVVSRRGQLDPDRIDRAADAVRQLEIGLDDRRGEPLPRRVTRIVQPVGQQDAATISDVADPSGNAGHPGDPRRPKRIRQENREVKPLSRCRRFNDREGPLVVVVRIGVEMDPVVEPGGRVERRRHLRLDHADDPGGREPRRVPERSAWP